MLLDLYQRLQTLKARPLLPEDAVTLNIDAGKPEAGQHVTLQCVVENGTIVDVRFAVYGCPYTILMIDYLATRLEGRALSSLPELSEIIAGLPFSLPPTKKNVLLLLQEVWQALELKNNLPS